MSTVNNLQCRYLRFSWVGSVVGGSMFVVMANCVLRLEASTITVGKKDSVVGDGEGQYRNNHKHTIPLNY